MIRIDALWLCTAPLDMRCGAERVLAHVVTTLGGVHAHHGYLFCNARSSRIKLLAHDGLWGVVRRAAPERGRVPQVARLLVAVGQEDGLGMEWHSYAVATTHVLEATGDGGWTVRVSGNVAAAIAADSQHWTPRETGGALLGHVDGLSRTIYIADLVPAPEDSERYPERFVLGTRGLKVALRQAHGTRWATCTMSALGTATRWVVHTRKPTLTRCSGWPALRRVCRWCRWSGRPWGSCAKWFASTKN